MALPAIGQASMIADQLVALVEKFCPSSVAVIGCAGGNGFDRVASPPVERLVGVDINPRYIDLAAARYVGQTRGLELYVGDIQNPQQIFQPVDLIYAALVFEYVDVAQSMRNLARHCVPGGVLATLVQLPHESKSGVTASPYSSLQRLAPAMQLIAPAELAAHATAARFELEDSSVIASPGGKLFAALFFRSEGDAENGREEIEKEEDAEQDEGIEQEESAR
jgi:SAM-dependent methyltransferase